MYKLLVDQYSNDIESALNKIIAQHNFDNGDELEIALGKILLQILPDKYGVCRGCAINGTGATTDSDDIIIFDKMLFPTLRSLEDGDLSIKEQVPIEAIYMYIECKSSIELGTHKNNFIKAINQVTNFKEFVDKREHMPIWQQDPYIPWNPSQRQPIHISMPPYRNPPCGIIFTKKITFNGKDISDQNEINQILLESVLEVETGRAYLPDLIIAGKSNIFRPALKIEGIDQPGPTWFMHKDIRSGYLCTDVENKAFGIGVIYIIALLNMMKLHTMPWAEMIKEAIKNPINTRVLET